MLRTSLCQRNKARNILTWYARIFDTETKEIRYESLGTTKKTEAHDIMTVKSQNGDFERKNEKESITLEKAFELYIKSLEGKGIKSDTIDNVVTAKNMLSSLLDFPVKDISKKMILETFLESSKNMMAGTHNVKKTIIKSAFKYFVNVLEIIPSNIAEVIPSRKNNPRERDFWTLEQIERILECTKNPQLRLAYSFMAFAGFRIHEALKAKPEDIRDRFVYVLGKGNKYAKVPVSSRLQKELERVGYKWDFSRINEKTTDIIRIAKEAIPEGFLGRANNHRFRHSFASNLIRSGVNIKAVQKLMRHSSINTTLNIYSHLIDDDLHDSIEKMFK